MIEGKELLEFATEMIKVLNEKAEGKYKDKWEESSMYTFFKGINDQADKLGKPLYNGNVEYQKRRLINIANFAFLLYNKL